MSVQQNFGGKKRVPPQNEGKAIGLVGDLMIPFISFLWKLVGFFEFLAGLLHKFSLLSSGFQKKN